MERRWWRDADVIPLACIWIDSTNKTEKTKGKTNHRSFWLIVSKHTIKHTYRDISISWTGGIDNNEAAHRNSSAAFNITHT